jgi:hypothetical protein
MPPCVPDCQEPQEIHQDTLLDIASRLSCAVESPGSWVPVGERKSAEVCVSYMPFSQAKKLVKLPQEKALLEL